MACSDGLSKDELSDGRHQKTVLSGHVIARTLDPVKFTQSVIDFHRAAGIRDLEAFKGAANGVQFAKDQDLVSSV